MIERFLDGNRRFAAGRFVERGEHYRALAQGQEPKLLWIGCADSRVSETAITDSEPGEIFVHRNVANLVTPGDGNVAAVLEYGLRHLAIPDVVVCGHFGCGGMQALDEGVDDPPIANWLMSASPAKAAVDATGTTDPARRHRLLVEANVRLQVENVRSTAVFRSAGGPSGRVRVHGWAYDLESGEIDVVVDGAAPVDGAAG